MVVLAPGAVMEVVGTWVSREEPHAASNETAQSRRTRREGRIKWVAPGPSGAQHSAATRAPSQSAAAARPSPLVAGRKAAGAVRISHARPGQPPRIKSVERH